MKRLFISAVATAALGLAASYVGLSAAFGQANEDDVATRMSKYPLAAKAGEDSHAIDKAPAGALNQGKFDDKTWKFGTAYDAAARLQALESGEAQDAGGRQGHRRHVVRLHRPGSLLRHGQCRLRLHLDRASARCPRLEDDRSACGRPARYAKAVPGVRVAYTDEREEQHALDAGALVLVVPTVRSYEEAIKARDWAFFPPLGTPHQWRRPGLRSSMRQRAGRLSQHHQ